MATSREQKEQEEQKDAGKDQPVEKKKRKRDKKLQNAVREQMEFYFSDANLHRDRFLKKEMEKEKEGWIDLSIILNFNKMKQLTSDPKMVVRSLRNSELLQVNAEKTKVRRTKPLAEPVQMDERTVYVECLPRTVTHEWIKTTFSVCGKVAYISLPRYKTTGDSKGFAFIEFEKQEAAEKACKMLNNPPDHMAGKMGVFPKTRKGRPIPVPTTPQATTDPPSVSDDTSTTPKSDKKKRKRKRKMDKDKAEGETTEEGEGQTGADQETNVGEAPYKRKREESESELAEKKPKLQVKSKEKTDEDEKTKDEKTKDEKTKVKSKEKADKDEKTKDEKTKDEKTKVKSKEKADKDEKTKDEKTKDATSQKGKEDAKEKEDTERDPSHPETREPEEGADRGKARVIHTAVSALIKEARGEGRKRRATDPGEAPSTEETHAAKKVKPSAKYRGEEGSMSDSEVSTKERRGKRKLDSVLSQETHSKRSRVEGHRESGELKKNKRKRKKKHREERRRDREPKKRKEDVRLRVIPKKEWLKLKNQYLAMQKANMSNLKKSLVAWNSGHQNGKAAEEGKQPAEADKTKAGRKAPEFVEGVVVKVKPAEPLESRQKLRDQLLPCGDIAYLDIQEGMTEGYIRFKTSTGAQKAAEKYGEIITLKGEEEKKYWDKVTADWEKKFQSPNQKEKKKRKKIRGTKKLLERAEKAAALQRQHVHFDGE
ncbi:la-related protein 7-like isoform X1 [Branchiostoma lanceolatum]|uniref:la-related protein 7-like isoform X1 n=1 Tax=Branchiostoma lanceolatum TaxID=7740 RepID=UPI003455ED23